MRAPRVRADQVQEGDQILTAYHPRTWHVVTAIVVMSAQHVGLVGSQYTQVMLDTDHDRTWWRADDLVPCRRVTA